jgi:inner membrane protein involved in colicin E2 resistance
MVTFRQLAAIAFIFVGASVAWTVLGASLVTRTGQFDQTLERNVQLLWGPPQRQVAPRVCVQRPAIDTEILEEKQPNGTTVRREVKKPVVRCGTIGIDSTRATVDLDLEHRRKGLLWYATYGVFFKATYTFRNPDADTRQLVVRFPLPAENALFDDFVFQIDGASVRPSGEVAKEMSTPVTVDAGAVTTLDVQYRSRGLRDWTYALAAEGPAEVRDFQLVMHTNFDEIDFPAGSMSPSDKRAAAEGFTLDWRFTNLISGQTIGMTFPEKLNPGPFAARVTFFAPVSLLFFLTVMVIVGATHGPSLHPMHYWFIACSFFAFHLLLAYLVDHISVHAAFAIAAAVSLLLVVSYLRVVTGARRALWWAASAQTVFLVLFSYAFFFEGFTGLTITIGAIITLFVLMQITARVSWDEIFAPKEHRSASRA